MPSYKNVLPSLLVFQKRVNDFHDAVPQDLFNVNIMENNVTAPMQIWFDTSLRSPVDFVTRIFRVRYTNILFLMLAHSVKKSSFPLLSF